MCYMTFVLCVACTCIYFFSVKALETHSYKSGQDICMRLMKRSKDSTYAMPVAQWNERNGHPHALTGNLSLCPILLPLKFI